MLKEEDPGEHHLLAFTQGLHTSPLLWTHVLSLSPAESDYKTRLKAVCLSWKTSDENPVRCLFRCRDGWDGFCSVSGDMSCSFSASIAQSSSSIDPIEERGLRRALGLGKHRGSTADEGRLFLSFPFFVSTPSWLYSLVVPSAFVSLLPWLMLLLPSSRYMIFHSPSLLTLPIASHS